MIGTMFAMVWGYIPFVSLVADASFPDELDTWISEQGLFDNNNEFTTNHQVVRRERYRKIAGANTYQ